MTRAQRWLGAFPEVGDTRGWAFHLLVRGPVSSVAILLAFWPAVLASVFQLRVMNVRRVVPILVLSFLAAYSIGLGRAWWLWSVRRSALAAGAVPYAVIAVRRDDVLIRFRRTRVKVPIGDLLSATGGERGIEVRWEHGGMLSGVHVSPSQSTLLPSGEIPNDVSMAAWISALIAERKHRR